MENSADSDSGSGTKLNIVAGKFESPDVTSRPPFNGWEAFCEFLRNCQPPRSLSECTADDAVDFLRRLPSDKVVAVVGTLSAATFQEIGGNNKENPFGSSIVRTFLKELLREKANENEYGKNLRIEVPNPTLPATSAETQEFVEKLEDVKTPLQLPFPEHSSPMVEPVFVITCDDNQDSEETYFISYIFNELCMRGFTPLRCDLTRSTVTGNLEMLCRSRVGIMIFSKNYARSRNCLDEFVAIMDHLKANDLVLLPVFFKVSLSDIRDHTGYFARAFWRLEKKVQAYKVMKWRAAIIELTVFNSYQYMKGDEVRLAKNIVRDVCLQLNSETNRNVKGIRVILKSILPLLHCPQSTGPHIVGLWGMAGIGKTTIMREIFRTQAERYDVSYFLPDFHIMCETKGLSHLRDEFFSKIFGEEKYFIDASDTKLSFIRDRFLDKRVLIVLDGVSNVGDAEVLVGGFGWFSGGHTIILSSRNRQILVQCKAKEVHEISKLSKSESYRLCCQYASEQNWKGRLLSELVNYASGIPLALRVLGLSLQNQRISNEKEHLRRLRQHPPIEIQDAFKRSFNGLDDSEKNIFLDLACFFRGEIRDHVGKILDGCGFLTDLGICGLVDESLISIVDNKIEMPNIFQDMGRFIVCQENEEAGKRSRLWESNDIADVLTNNLGTETIEGIFLDASGLTFELSPTVFERMYRIRLLKLQCPSSENHCKVLLPQGLSSLPDELRLLHWERYTLQSLPRNFNPKHLVELNMPYSNIKKLWKGKKNLEKLKRIIMSHSEQLAKFPRLSKARNLEYIDLEGCTSLVKVNSSIHHLHKLTFLSLKDCSHLRIMPTTVHLESLEVLNLSGCSELEDVQGFSPNLKELYLAGTAIKELPLSILDLTRLTTLDLENCKRLQHLPPGISDLKALVTIKLSGCANLESLSILYALYLRDLQHLNPKITMDESVFLKLHSATQEPRLEGSETLLNSDNLQLRSDIPGLPVFGYLSSDRLTQANWPWNTITPLPSSILHSLASILYALVSLFLCNTCLVDLPEEIRWLPSVKTLDLGGNSFSQIPESIKELRKLQSFRLRHCKKLRSLPELPRSLEILNAHGCVSLEAFPSSFGQFPRHYTFTNCFSLSPEVVKQYIGNALESFEGMAKGHLQEHRKAPAFSICMPTSACRESSIDFQAGSKARIIQNPGMRKTPSGFVLSVVVEFWENYRNAVGFGIKCICRWKTNQGLSLGLERTFQFWAPKEAPIVQKDHMFVFGYVTIHPDTAEGHDLDILNGLMTFEFHPVNLQKKLLDDSCTVKKCGVRLITTETCDEPLNAKRLASSVDPGELSGVEHMTPPYKRYRFKRVIESVILSLRKRKREKSVSRIIKRRIINRSKLGSVALAESDHSFRNLEQKEEKKSLGFYPNGVWSLNALPERPGMPECAYYMRTGDCGYGNFCRFHHPRDRVSESSLSPIDLPLRPDQFGSVIPSIFDHNSKNLKQKEEAEGRLLRLVGTTVQPRNVFPERPGQPNCIYYIRTGVCKFGNSCKFNHPRIKPESSLSPKDLSLKTAQTYAQRIDRYFMTPKAPHLYPPSSKLADTSDEKLGRFPMQITSSRDAIDAEQEEE